MGRSKTNKKKKEFFLPAEYKALNLWLRSRVEILGLIYCEEYAAYYTYNYINVFLVNNLNPQVVHKLRAWPAFTKFTESILLEFLDRTFLISFHAECVVSNKIRTRDFRTFIAHYFHKKVKLHVKFGLTFLVARFFYRCWNPPLMFRSHAWNCFLSLFSQSDILSEATPKYFSQSYTFKRYSASFVADSKRYREFPSEFNSIPLYRVNVLAKRYIGTFVAGSELAYLKHVRDIILYSEPEEFLVQSFDDLFEEYHCINVYFFRRSHKSKLLF